MSKRINEETKQIIIEKIRSEGLSVPKASEEFGLSKNTIYSWIG
ncbi:helix-turn-helix domain-containing protein, partial [Candidatus Parcubacteria bacterium]|nr:helix-turn-helix domain-containing protein [Candidatus Parcubacteria bacterium]MCK5061563.1 helix-turn-helix domain-containing protein [Candidatus Parcubacteria bacterium]